MPYWGKLGENLKTIRGFGWKWLTRFKSNRIVSLQSGENRQIRQLLISERGTIAHLRGYCFVKETLNTGQLMAYRCTS